MTYPSGVQTATLTFSNPGTFTGAAADTVTMTVVSTASVTWSATGTPIDNFTEVVTPGPGLPGSLTAPLVDQTGFIDGTGNAFTMWAYQLTRRASFGAQTKVITKNWQPIAGQTTIDFDDLPGGPIGLPVSVPASPVTSVAGLTGIVDATALAGAIPLDASTAANITTPASATAAALNATYARPSGASVGLLGDSITNNNGVIGGYLFNTGYWAWGDLFLGHRLDLQYIDGIPGSGCLNAGWAARVATFAAQKLSWCVLEIGTNDVSADGSFTDITSALTTTLDTLAAAGAQVALLTVPPRNALTAPQQIIHGQVNAWIRQLPSARRGVVVADVSVYLSDPTNATPANYVPAFTSDGTHPTPSGCKQMGMAIFKALDHAVPIQDGITGPASDTANLLGYSAASWAGGASAKPTSWTESNGGTAPTYSQIARTDGIPGVVQRVVVPTGGTAGLHATLTGPFTVGDRIAAYVEMADVSGIDPAPAVNTQNCNAYLVSYTSAYAVAAATGTLYENGTQPNVTPAPGMMHVQTLTIPTGGTLELDFFITLNGGGTYDLGRVGAVRVGAAY